jgi:hypothetical protein
MSTYRNSKYNNVGKLGNKWCKWTGLNEEEKGIGDMWAGVGDA